jgi:UDP-N-acetylglucosamine acyltransferase
MSGIHPLAVVDASARIGADVTIGPFTVIGSDVTIGDRSEIGPHVQIHGPTVLGSENRVYPSVCLGMDPQDLKFANEPVRLEVGHRNTIREFTTFHRGTGKGGGLTTVGDDNLFMVYSHVAHDCHVGSRTIFANCATLAGHVEVGDDAVVGAFSAVQQFGRVGKYAYVGGYTRLLVDALPYVKTVGLRPAVFGVNRIGLRRKGLDDDRIRTVEKAMRIFLRSGLNTTQALERLEAEFPGAPDVEYLIGFVRSARRGVVKALPTHRGASESGGD